jgi:uncharacterized membrane protein
MKNIATGFGLALILSSYAAEAQGQSITNLGTLPGAADSYAFGVSADGLTVAGNSGLRPFRWSAATGMQLLPVLVPLGPNQAATGVALSADGSAIVGHCDVRPVRWTSAGVSDLGSTGAPGGAFAADVSADGGTIVGYSGTSSFVWRQGSGMQQIAPDSQATAISADGFTIAGYLYSSNNAFRWRPPGSLESSIAGGGVEDLSDDGSVMVGWIQTEFGQRGYRWTVSSGVQLLPPLAGASSANAAAVSGDGLIVAGTCQVASVNHAFVWSESAGTVSLRDLLLSRGVDLSGWTSLTSITSMSADGRVVVGYGTSEGSTRAFLADISEPPPCALADLFADSVVNGADLGILLSQWGPASASTVSDLNRDGNVDGADLGYLLANWGSCAN